MHRLKIAEDFEDAMNQLVQRDVQLKEAEMKLQNVSAAGGNVEITEEKVTEEKSKVRIGIGIGTS